MNWTEVNLSVDRAEVPCVQAALEALAALAVTLRDHADQPVLEPAAGSTPLWPRVEVCGLFDDAVDRDQVARKLQDVSPAGAGLAIHWRDVEDQNWERAWMDRFEPMQFGDHLWIVPSGMDSPADSAAVIIKLDPGLAFGTGTHPTTALCLQWIDQHHFEGRRVIDYGCGSGVLGIAAALKGANEVICVDNDPQALEATADNAGRNGISGQLRCLAPADYARVDAEADVVLANILAGPLIELASILTHSLRPGGELVLSGLLESQCTAVNNAYRRDFGELGVALLDGWARLDGRRLMRN